MNANEMNVKACVLEVMCLEVAKLEKLPQGSQRGLQTAQLTLCWTGMARREVFDRLPLGDVQAVELRLQALFEENEAHLQQQAEEVRQLCAALKRETAALQAEGARGDAETQGTEGMGTGSGKVIPLGDTHHTASAIAAVSAGMRLLGWAAGVRGCGGRGASWKGGSYASRSARD
jgi:hypothetical protein